MSGRVLTFMLFAAWLGCFRAGVAMGQQSSSFVLDISNGLPSNRVYGMTKDRLGYLWLATEKGVVRYNGYDFRIFNVADGLPTEDVWQVLEDRKGRIWLGSIADGIGYIYKNRYHKAYLAGKHIIIYPELLSCSGDGILFLTPDINSPDPTLCVEKNDTIYRYNLLEKIRADTLDGPELFGPKITLLQSKTGERIVFCRNRFYKLDITGNNVFARYLCSRQDSTRGMNLPLKSDRVCGNFVIRFNPLGNPYEFYEENLLTGETTKVDIRQYIKGKRIRMIYVAYSDTSDRDFYVDADSSILHFTVNDEVVYCETLTPADMCRTENAWREPIAYQVRDDSIWATCHLNASKGMSIVHGVENHFRKYATEMSGFSYVGGVEDSVHFWWNAEAQTLAIIGRDLSVRFIKYPDVSPIKAIIPYGLDTFVAMSLEANYWLSPGNWRLKKADLSLTVKNPYAIIAEDKHNYYTVYIDFYHIKTGQGNSTLDIVDHDRYLRIVYDSFRKSYWAYNQEKILVYNGQKTIYENEGLFRFGMQRIHTVLVDNKYGNIFFDNNKVTLYDFDKNEYRELFGEYNLTESDAFIYRNTLIIAGRFGILFSKILGPQQVSAPMVYPNIKSDNYRYIYDAQVSDGQVLLLTDKGAYTVAIPTDSEIIHGNDVSIYRYRFLADYRGDNQVINNGDTIHMVQSDPTLRFDVINPLGSGHVKYFVSYTSAGWKELNANEMNTTWMKPGRYYRLSIRANDDIWKSREMYIWLFTRPYWWQQLLDSNWFWAGLAGILLALFGLIVLITKWFVTQSNARMNWRSEVELKSVYSQINPHFIFNTLAAAQYFIKKKMHDEAYEHVSRFSRLLRAYLKSSRNKYITLASEIESLNDYIQLQQVRFVDKFDYEIVVDPELNAAGQKIPALLLQPIVENAINHGLFHKETMGHLKIVFRKIAGNGLECIVDDDGIGRKKARQLAEESIIKRESYGSSLVTDLASIFNKYEKTNITVDYVDKAEPETGTTVIVRIKFPAHEK